MQPEQFTQHPKVLSILHELREESDVEEKQFSDVVDAEGLQYVDLVMEGGGVWGIALAGYVFILEEMGIRFLQLAGASAGAINTLFLAAAGPINQRKTNWVLNKLSEKDLSEFIDGDSDAQEFVATLLEGTKLLKLAWKGVQVVDNIREDQGLNPGDNFKQWVKDCLVEKGVNSTADLRDLRVQVPNGLVRKLDDGETEPYPAEHFKRIGIISSEITTETKAVFPEMADLYWANPDDIHPAEYVRASMSIPMFFHPYTVKNIPQGEGTWEKWREATGGYEGGAPSEVRFIDGGIVSNFPIDIFHDYQSSTPAAPTFGVKLEIDRNQPNNTDSFFGLAGAIFNTARHIHDNEFIKKHPDFHRLVTYIDTGDHNWLNFNLTEEDQMDLFVRGARAACDFLQKFDWDEYKKIRRTYHEQQQQLG